MINVATYSMAGVTHETWTDSWGRKWRISRTRGRLNFNYPAHAALRVHVHHRDGYRCLRCAAKAEVPAYYDGKNPLTTDVMLRGWPVILVLDHITPRAAGGLHTVGNLQTLCETCNLRKLGEDMAVIGAFRRRGDRG
jgi:hypothetical protein